MIAIDYRLSEEEQLALLLLLIFASQDLEWFLRPYGPSFSWFQRQITNSEIPDVARRVVDNTQLDMLDELELDLFGDRRVRTGLDGFEDQFIREMSRSLSRSHENWLRSYEKKRRQQQVLPEVYPSWKAKRDSVTKITQAVSHSQNKTRTALDQFFGIKLLAQWKLDPFSNWCELCLSLADQYEAQWRRIFPGDPPAHFACRCHVKFTHWLGNDGPDQGYPTTGRRGVEAPQRILDPFQRRLDRLNRNEPFARILTTL